MAASDPTPYVATPTGTLQGVAAFSWDGSAWQPSGRAGPSVATPTGVLQGVAAFNCDPVGTWQPSGRAGPSVATPTGVLEGVAVYTWDGSAWRPQWQAADGYPIKSTPSGAPRCVAAFSWDGSAWQPAAQAGPTVVGSQPGIGVLEGVAVFNWNGAAWVAGAASPPGLTLDLSFMSGALDPRITFTRASTATYFDSSGVLQTAATNAPRFDYAPVTHAARGLLIEEARTNLLLNSATLGTQGVAVTAQAYILSFYGTGTITMSGAFAGSLVGTGAFPTRVQTTFTPAAGTLTCTVTGSVLNAQLEAGSFVTSWISTTAAAVTRAYDYCTIPAGGMGFYTGAPGGSWMAEFVNIDPVYTGKAGRIIGQASAGGVGPLYLPSTLLLSQYDGGVLATANTVTANVITKGASTWAPGAGRICLNGSSVASGALSGGYPQLGAGIAFFASGAGTVSEDMNGYLRRVRYWPRVLSNAELQSVTT